MAEYYTLLTNIGRSKLTAAQVEGTKVPITHIAVGDSNGTVYEPTGSETTLVHELWRGILDTYEVDVDIPTRIRVASEMPQDKGDFYVREIGLFDLDGDLIAIANYPSKYKPSISSGVGNEMIVELLVDIGSINPGVMTIDPSYYLATSTEIYQAIDGHNSDLNAHNDININADNAKVLNVSNGYVKVVDEKITTVINIIPNEEILANFEEDTEGNVTYNSVPVSGLFYIKDGETGSDKTWSSTKLNSLINSKQDVIIISQTTPLTPTLDMLWLNTTAVPYILKMYDGTIWQAVGATGSGSGSVDLSPITDRLDKDEQDILGLTTEFGVINAEITNLTSELNQIITTNMPTIIHYTDLFDVEKPYYTDTLVKVSKDLNSLEFYLEDKTPSSTKDMQETGTIFTSLEYIGYEAVNAFNHDATSYWKIDSPASIGYAFKDKARTIYKYAVKVPNSISLKGITDITLEGSNTLNGVYTLLNTQSNINFSSGEEKIFTLSAPCTYKVFRLKILNYSGDECAIQSVKLLGNGLQYLYEDKADKNYVDFQDIQTYNQAKTYTDSNRTDLELSILGTNGIFFDTLNLHILDVLKADKTYTDTQDTALQTQITNLESSKADASQVSQTSTYLQSSITSLSSGKADKTYTDTQDTALQTQITSMSASKTDKTYVDTNITTLESSINTLDSKIDSKDVTNQTAHTQIRTDFASADSLLQTQITGLNNSKVSKAYADTQDTALQTQITNLESSKADKTYTDTQINLKSDKTYVDTQLNTKADSSSIPDISGKADKTYTDTQDTALQTQITNLKNKSDIYITLDGTDPTGITPKENDVLLDNMSKSFKIYISGTWV